MKRSLSILLVLAFTVSSNLGALAKAPDQGTAVGITKIAGLEKGMVSAEEKVDGKIYHLGKTIVNASPEQVFAVITDYPNATRLFDNLKQSNVVAVDADKNTTDVSFSLKGLANIWNFDYVLRMTETYPSRIDFYRLSGAFKANQGYWKIEPIDAQGKKSLVTYAKYIDGGMIPQSIVTKQLKDAMPAVMANVKSAAEAHAVQVSLK